MACLIQNKQNQHNVEVTSSVADDCDFIPVTPRKFLGCDGKINDSDIERLQRGYGHVVDDFTYYYRSAWYPTFRRKPIRKLPIKRVKPRNNLKVKVNAPAFILPWDIVQMMCEVNQLEREKFMKTSLDNPFDAAFKAALKQKLHDSLAQRASSVIEEMNGPPPTIGGSTIQNTTFTRTRVGCVHKSTEIHFNWFNTYSTPCFRWNLYVDLRSGTKPAEVLLSQHCPECSRRDFSIRVYTRGNLDDFALYIYYAWQAHPNFPKDFIRDFIMKRCSGFCCNPWCDDFSSDEDEDVKRDSKSHKPVVSLMDRKLHLSQRENEIGKRAKLDFLKLQKEKRQNASHKSDMRKLFPRTEGLFDINVQHQHEHHFDLAGVEAFISSIQCMIPTGFASAVQWTDVVVSIYTLVASKEWSSRYLAMSTLHKQFGVKGMTISALSAYAINVSEKYLGSSLEDAKNAARIQSGSDFHEFKTDGLTSLCTIMLSLFLGKPPSKTRTDYFIGTLGDLPRKANGLQFIIECAKKCINYVLNITTPHDMLEKACSDIRNKVNVWLTQEGNLALMNSESGFDDVAIALMEANDIVRVLPKNSSIYYGFQPTLFQLNQLYKKVQMSPCAGHAYRKEPVVLHLWGHPGLGKTMMINGIAADALKHIFDLEEVDDETQKERLSNYFQYIYYKPIGNKYHTNYNSAWSKIYVADDANQVDHKELKDDLPFPVELIHLANNSDHLLNVAEVENKRNAKFNSSLIIATDNAKYPDLSYLTSVDAYKRRITL